MYNIGDMVLYGGEGICKIVGIEDKKIADKVIQYYALSPEGIGNSVFYVPTEGKVAESKIRKIINGSEIKAIIEKSQPAEWEENDRIRRDNYNKAINSADREMIISLIKCCDIHKEEVSKQGKRLYKVDEYFLAEAEKLLYGEFKNVFKIERNEIVSFILGKYEPEEIWRL